MATQIIATQPITTGGRVRSATTAAIAASAAGRESLRGVEGGRYTISATTGQITTYAALNYEAGTPSATYTVIARDNAEAGAYTQAQTSVTIGIDNLNEVNSIPASYSFAVNENVGIGTAVGTVGASDIDSASVAFSVHALWRGARTRAVDQSRRGAG